MTSTGAASFPRGRVRVLVTEPVPQDLGGGCQPVETRDDNEHPGKVAFGDSVAGNARRSRRLPFGPLDTSPAPTAPPCLGCGDPVSNRYKVYGVCGDCFNTTDDPEFPRK